ncbi:hypothetical protein [Cypionkella sp.]|uniref:hypothetical protein n=1 Tax=Cypionkella sp. TaxID=2811411 RepID=UPI002721B215|nr:hypothetical protein [Cypionkella sp.]MDO8983958.1 hypothetical protein [Cypionkella sp.]
MTDKPILFSAPMVRALLAGTKTQTRRALPTAHPKFPGLNRMRNDLLIDPQEVWYWDGVYDGVGASMRLRIAPGDRLYVREHWRAASAYDDLSPSDMGGEESIRYEADQAWQTWGWPVPVGLEGRFRQGIHMPRWASRLTLTVTEVRVQRLQDISEADAVAEGADAASIRMYPELGTARHWYQDLWNSINGESAWDKNPWVAAYSFTVQNGNIDQVAK